MNPKEAVAGSKTGLLLWFHSIVPVLLPFMILSKLMIAWNGLSFVTRLLKPVTQKILGISSDGTYALLLGYLCGYPMGAKLIGDLVKDGRISTEEGNYLMLFCNHASPAFLMGFALTEQINLPQMIPFTLCIVYGVPLILAVFSHPIRNMLQSANTTKEVVHTPKQASGFQISFKIIDACIMNGLESILKLGCYIILFSMTARLAALIPFRNDLITAILVGTLEITNGIAAVSSIKTPILMKYLTVLGFLSFGGISTAAQVSSMIQGSGLSFSNYLWAKVITTAAVIATAYVLIKLLPWFHLLRSV